MKKNFADLSRKKFRQNILTLIILGLAVHLILPQITSLENSFQVLEKMIFWAVGLAFLAQLFSYFGSGYLLQMTLELVKETLSLFRCTLMVLGAASVSMVAGGTVGNSAAIFRWTKSEKGIVSGVTIASLFPSLFNSLMLVFFSIFGITHLFINHNLSKTQIIGFGLTLGFLGVVIFMSVLANHFRMQAKQSFLWIANMAGRFTHHPIDKTNFNQNLADLFLAWDELWQGKWHKLLLGSFINTGFDILTLYFMFMAVRKPISFGILLSGYALPLLLGRVAFFLPGGVGVVESSMAALYTGLGIPNATSVVVILGYRLISFWIPSIAGFPIAGYLQNIKTVRKNQ